MYSTVWAPSLVRDVCLHKKVSYDPNFVVSVRYHDILTSNVVLSSFLQENGMSPCKNTILFPQGRYVSTKEHMY
jgi:hypothetical protein